MSTHPRFNTFLTPPGPLLIRGPGRVEDRGSNETFTPEPPMTDLLYIAAFTGFFLASGFYIRFCEKL
ncbi:hypothetical protein [Verrucomicrobium spinosum]|uniref:hypothetical protein n=1 Tax=Verrucomicrobium spinosum TaxID=2736 RepID=UPI0012F6D8CA|nr:hypothetical protein [Verrucomicrobium spinosum]